MDFELSDEQLEIRGTFRRFAREWLKPRAEEIDLGHAFPREAFEKIGELGLFGMRYPEEDGRPPPGSGRFSPLPIL